MKNNTLSLRRRYAKYKNQRLQFKIYEGSKFLFANGIFCDIKSTISSNGKTKKATLFFRGICLLDSKNKNHYLSSPKDARKIISKFIVHADHINDLSWDALKEKGLVQMK